VEGDFGDAAVGVFCWCHCEVFDVFGGEVVEFLVFVEEDM
jgi:hypothetical protein